MKFMTDNLAEKCDKVVKARLRLCTEIIRRISVLCRECVDNTIGNISCIDEITRLPTATKNCQRVSLHVPRALQKC